jgi:cytoskeletal protein RodZ
VTSLGDLLLTARERKGVDLYRAERDTKIRARYLAALERGDYSELPGTVYTKGFLRNYASYLGLDPDVVLAQYHREHGASRTEPVAIVPRPLEAPKSGLTLTPGLAVGALLAIAVLAFAGFIVLQLFRFSRPPTLSVTDPPTLVSEMPGADRTVLVGTSDPGATITIRGPSGQPMRLTADSAGRWQQEVTLTKGRNDFTITATDPVTGKDSSPLSLVITVPIPVMQAPTLSVTSPQQNAVFHNSAIPIQGTTNGTSVTVSARYTGPAASPAPGSAPPEAPAQPRSKQIVVAGDGTFSASYPLAPGRWTLTIRAVSADEMTATETRTITVSYTGVSLVLEVRGSKTQIKVWVDGKIDPELGEGGQTLPAGTTLEFLARQSVEVRTDSAGATFFTVNGDPVGTLGKVNEAGTWLFAPPAGPKKTNRE